MPHASGTDGAEAPPVTRRHPRAARLRSACWHDPVTPRGRPPRPNGRGAWRVSGITQWSTALEGGEGRWPDTPCSARWSRLSRRITQMWYAPRCKRKPRWWQKGLLQPEIRGPADGPSPAPVSYWHAHAVLSSSRSQAQLGLAGGEEQVLRTAGAAAGAFTARSSLDVARVHPGAHVLVVLQVVEQRQGDPGLDIQIQFRMAEERGHGTLDGQVRPQRRVPIP